MNNIYVEIKEKCCSKCDAECDGCWLEELIANRLAEERKKVVKEIRETIFEYLKVNSMEDLQKLSLLESTLTYDVITDKLDQIERGV